MALEARIHGLRYEVLFYSTFDATRPYSGMRLSGNSTPTSMTLYGDSGVNSKYAIIVAGSVSLVGTSGRNNDDSSPPTGSSPIQQVSRSNGRGPATGGG
jgi:hypothetical protein